MATQTYPGLYFHVHPQTGELLEPTLAEADRLPDNLVGLLQESLDDLTCVGWYGEAYWPQLLVTPDYNPLLYKITTLGAPVVDLQNKQVISTFNVEPLTQQEIDTATNADIKKQIAEIEAATTARMIREAALGIDNGHLLAVQNQIAALRAKIVKE